MNHKEKSSPRDHLTLTTEQGRIELTEQELSRVTGAAVPVDYFKYDHKIDFLKLA